MKNWKMISGILSMVLFLLVSFQSCAAGLGNALSGSSEGSGFAGIVLALLMLTGGIVSVVSRDRESIAVAGLDGLAALIGYTMAGSYKDLRIWAGWCFVQAVIAAMGFAEARLDAGRYRR